jgi:hypothetical protein
MLGEAGAPRLASVKFTTGAAFTVTLVVLGLLPAVKLVPPLLSLVAPVPTDTVCAPVAVGVKLKLQLKLEPAAKLAELAGQFVVVKPGSPVPVAPVCAPQLALVAAAVAAAAFVQLTVHVTAVPTVPGLGVHETLLVISEAVTDVVTLPQLAAGVHAGPGVGGVPVPVGGTEA